MEPVHGNPSQEPTNATSQTLEDQQGHENMVDGNPRTDSNAGGSNGDSGHVPAASADSGHGGESSDDDVPISSMSRHDDGEDLNSVAVEAGENGERGTNDGSDIENPPTHVIENPEDPSSPYRIPSHVFATSNITGEWSICSNESLFSIHMGNMSFSREMAWMKSGELGSLGDMSMVGPPDVSPSNMPPVNPNPPAVANLAPVNKLNDIGPGTSYHDESPGATEAKAAETMREVIREHTEKNGRRDLSFREGDSHPNRISHQSNGSTTSFAFPILAGDGNKGASSAKGIEEKPDQQKLSDTGTHKETDGADNPEPTKSTKNTSQNKWLSCFSCCTFCH